MYYYLEHNKSLKLKQFLNLLQNGFIELSPEMGYDIFCNYFGVAESDKNEKKTGWFYRGTTDGSFTGSFQKNATVFGARSHAPIFFTIFSPGYALLVVG